MSRANDYEKQGQRNLKKIKLLPCLSDWCAALGCPEVKINITASHIADDVLDEIEKP